jgi:diaminopropionate ammonia-lyase
MDFSTFDNAVIGWHENDQALRGQAFPGFLKNTLSAADCARAKHVIEGWDGYQATPLHSLRGFAKELGVEDLYYKDEGGRFGLGSFKALGGAYAVLRLLAEEIPKISDEPASDEAIGAGRCAATARQLTVVTATDGNHGRSVAWGAQQFGCGCKIYMHAGVSQQREQAVVDLGAEVIRVDGNYDVSVHQAAADAAQQGWFVVSDTSYDGYIELPQQVMAGYTVMTAEIVEQLKQYALPTHVFVQGGVGGLAGAVCLYFWRAFGTDRPSFIVVEPDRADCLLQSAVQGRPTTVDIHRETIMAGLSCGEVSTLGWDILSIGCDHFMAIPDELVAPTMRYLANGQEDPAIVAGESAVAGLAGLIVACRSSRLRKALGLSADSRILVLGTEGATDPEIYASVVGRSAEDVASSVGL